MRSKEDAQDYRYFPEPDLVPIVVSDEWLQQIRDNQPELHDEKLARYIAEFGLSISSEPLWRFIISSATASPIPEPPTVWFAL